MDRKSKKIAIHTADPGYENFPVSIMNRSTHEAHAFDPSLGKPATISYRLPKSGCIRIRIVRRNQPKLLIRTLQDWTEQDFGRYRLEWDGRDASGNIVDNKKAQFIFDSKDRDDGLQHESHDAAVCKDYVLTISTNSDNLEMVKGTLTLKVILSEEIGSFGESTGFEVRYFVDYQLVKSERVQESVKEFHSSIDTTGISNGEHFITVNVDDFHDHLGTASIKIILDN